MCVSLSILKLFQYLCYHSYVISFEKKNNKIWYDIVKCIKRYEKFLDINKLVNNLYHLSFSIYHIHKHVYL